jgi:CHASE2 domain-containing sensor protein
MGWCIFFGVLLLPALLTLTTARAKDVWPLCTFLLSFPAAGYCGFFLARRITHRSGALVLTGLALSAALYVVSFVLCCAGCTLGGAELYFR